MYVALSTTNRANGGETRESGNPTGDLNARAQARDEAQGCGIVYVGSERGRRKARGLKARSDSEEHQNETSRTHHAPTI